MKRQIIFKVDDKDSFFELTEAYFSGAGFKKSSHTANQMSFAKGSVLLNMVTFNPLNWRSKVKITLQNETAVADFDINTVGQLITPKEEELWDVFIENYKISIVDKVDVTAENQKHLRQTKRDSLVYIVWALIGAVVFGVPFGLLAYFTDIDTLASMGAVFGALFFVTYKINREKQKNAL